MATDEGRKSLRLARRRCRERAACEGDAGPGGGKVYEQSLKIKRNTGFCWSLSYFYILLLGQRTGPGSSMVWDLCGAVTFAIGANAPRSSRVGDPRGCLSPRERTGGGPRAEGERHSGPPGVPAPEPGRGLAFFLVRGLYVPVRWVAGGRSEAGRVARCARRRRAGTVRGRGPRRPGPRAGQGRARSPHRARTGARTPDPHTPGASSRRGAGSRAEASVLK